MMSLTAFPISKSVGYVFTKRYSDIVYMMNLLPFVVKRGLILCQSVMIMDVIEFLEFICTHWKMLCVMIK